MYIKNKISRYNGTTKCEQITQMVLVSKTKLHQKIVDLLCPGKTVINPLSFTECQ